VPRLRLAFVVALVLASAAAAPAAGADPVPPGDPAATTIGDGFSAVAPTRLLDTRHGAKPGAGSVSTVAVAGVGTVPATARAGVATVTVTEPDEAGFVTAYPCGGAVPLASSLNFRAGQTVANLVTAALGLNGAVCLYANVPAHVIVDLAGWYGPGGNGFATVAPARTLDTRQSVGKAAAGSVLHVAVGRIDGVAKAGSVKAAALNLTITQPDGAGYATAYPCDQPAPLASNVNFIAGRDAADAVVVAVATTGDVCVLVSARTHVVVDVTGWFGAGATGVFAAATPVRLTDTRTVGTPVPAGGMLAVPTGVRSGTAVLNVTATDPQAPGYLTAYPCATALPATSTVNFGAGDTVPNAAAVAVDTVGYVCVFASAPTHVIVDLAGTSSAGAPATTGAPLAQAALDWGATQIGAPYAAINPYRFGDSKYGKPWDCPDGQPSCARVDIHGGTRTVAAGTFVYDCSGFAVAAWLRAGVDLIRKNASWTDAMYFNLPHLSAEQALPGDLVLFGQDTTDPADGDVTDHVGLYVDRRHMLQSGAGCPTGANGLSVCVRTIDWSRVVAIARAW
jgi:hypothetical protein